MILCHSMKFITDFKELYQRYAGDIFRFSLYLCGDTVEAEDITAETFARALTGKAPLASATVKGYLLTIARNLYLEMLRKRKSFVEISPEMPDSSLQLEQSVIHKNELERLLAFMQTLPEKDRSALLLRADGLEYSEIARELNITLASAKVKVHRLRLKLAKWRVKQ